MERYVLGNQTWIILLTSVTSVCAFETYLSLFTLGEEWRKAEPGLNLVSERMTKGKRSKRQIRFLFTVELDWYLPTDATPRFL